MLLDFTFIILLGTVGGIAAKYFKQPTVVGYLVAGLLGSLFFPEFVKHKDAIDSIAELGVALLLFTLGIEFNVTRISKVAKVAVFGGIIQIILSIGIYELLLISLGISAYTALFVASGFALSSTAVVVKILNEKKMLSTLQGEIMIAWLLVQDLSVVPLLILLPLLSKGLHGEIVGQLIWPIIISLLFVVFIVTIGRKITTLLLTKIAKANSQELLLLATLSLCVFVAGITQMVGLSFALGAFLAGVMVADSTEQHAMFSEIRPLRDLFTTVFFVSLALLVPAGSILAFLPFAFLLAILVIFIKFCIVVFITWFFGYHSKVSFLVGIALIQVGEFAFVLMREGLRLEIISESMYSLVLTVTIITILLTPALFSKSTSWYESIRRELKRKKPKMYEVIFNRGESTHHHEELPFKNHVVLLGYGRMGKYIGRALQSVDIPFVVVEFNRIVVEKLKKERIAVVYGDPTDYDILDFAQVDRAKALVIAVPDLSTQLSVIVNARKLNQNIMIISRFHYAEDQKVLKGVGADFLIHPEFAASLATVEKMLSLFKQDKDDISKTIKRLKIEHGME
jgi:CPA2 family monovalent cation:H+ antiporter-2